MQAYGHGVSTREVNDLVKALRAVPSISRSEVSRICTGLDAEVAKFRDRTPASQGFLYLFHMRGFIGRAGGSDNCGNTCLEAIRKAGNEVAGRFTLTAADGVFRFMTTIRWTSNLGPRRGMGNPKALLAVGVLVGYTPGWNANPGLCLLRSFLQSPRRQPGERSSECFPHCLSTQRHRFRVSSHTRRHRGGPRLISRPVFVLSVGNEHFNGGIRGCLPEGTSGDDVTQEKLCD